MDKRAVRWLLVGAVLVVGVGASAAERRIWRDRLDLDQSGTDRGMDRRDVMSS
jgi:hypothetical protein